jgi:hypothetical protein
MATKKTAKKTTKKPAKKAAKKMNKKPATRRTGRPAKDHFAVVPPNRDEVLRAALKEVLDEARLMQERQIVAAHRLSSAVEGLVEKLDKVASQIDAMAQEALRLAGEQLAKAEASTPPEAPVTSTFIETPGIVLGGGLFQGVGVSPPPLRVADEDNKEDEEVTDGDLDG